MKKIGLLSLVLALLPATACGERRIEVDDPFYLTYIESRAEMALFRCPNHGEHGCSSQDLPDPTVFAAGVDRRYIVLVRHPYRDGEIDRGVTEYFYFARKENEGGPGWGLTQEVVIGPLNQAQFRETKARLRLPDFTVVVDDLK